ncbi:hypothetical protein J2Y68_003056 [Paenarthrobacter nitroguajacolicus]|nr:hypothetical protein [Paenarthrobacter nitroguajacolicus]
MAGLPLPFGNLRIGGPMAAPDTGNPSLVG